MANWFEQNAPKKGNWFEQNAPSSDRPAGLPEGMDLPQLAAHPAANMQEPGRLLADSRFGKRLDSNVSGLITPMLHPFKSAMTNPGWSDPGKMGDAVSTLRANPNLGGVSDVLADAATSAVVGGGLKLLPQAAGLLGTGVRNIGATLNNAVMGTTADALETGANPGRALSSNRIIGSNPSVLSSRVNKVIPNAAAEERSVYAANPGGAKVNVGAAINQPFDDLVAAKTNPTTGAAVPSQIYKARTTQSALNNVQDPTTGKPTTALRNPIMDPVDAVNLKSNIYDMADYDNPSRSAISNRALKGAAHNLKELTVAAVPEAAPYTQRLHDLMAARELLNPKSKFVKLPTSKEGFIQRGVTFGGTSLGAGADLLGSGIKGASRYLKAPVIFPVPLKNGNR